MSGNHKPAYQLVVGAVVFRKNQATYAGGNTTMK